MPSRFSENLSRLRREKGVSQRLVASELHVSQALLSHYENGVREPGLDFVCRVCGYYGVSADFLLGLTDRREPDVPPAPEAVEEPGLRMVTDVGALLWKALDQVGDPVLLEQGMDFVADAVYKVFRHLYHRAGTDEAALFQVPASEFSFLSDADMKVREMNFLKQLKKLPQGQLPRLSGEELRQNDPRLLDSFQELCQGIAVRLQR